MRKRYYFFKVCVVFICLSLTSARAQDANIFKSIAVDTLLQTKISIRAITIDKKNVYYAGDNGKFGIIDLENKTRNQIRIQFDTLKIEFRSIAATAKSIFALNVGNPALLFEISKGENPDFKLRYSEKNKKVFYDSMQFWNDSEGIAVGDPIENCLSILVTRDAGQSWQKIPCANLPKTSDGEAAFAASNTNIIIKGAKTWIVSGGKKARIFYSSDKGNTWEVFDTPIVHGKTMTGIFTADFYDEKNGIIAGGNYEILNHNSGNKAITEDGGKTWKLVAENSGFGYASCVQYVPGSNANGIVCVGTSGLFYSSDRAKTWTKFSDDKELYTIRFQNETTAIAAGKDKIVRISLKK